VAAKLLFSIFAACISVSVAAESVDGDQQFQDFKVFSQLSTKDQEQRAQDLIKRLSSGDKEVRAEALGEATMAAVIVAFLKDPPLAFTETDRMKARKRLLPVVRAALPYLRKLSDHKGTIKDALAESSTGEELSTQKKAVDELSNAEKLVKSISEDTK
jgi:hypothetical protein